jgi:hypothetical protein
MKKNLWILLFLGFVAFQVKAEENTQAFDMVDEIHRELSLIPLDGSSLQTALPEPKPEPLPGPHTKAPENRVVDAQ